MTRPALSVVVPAYNAAAHVGTCLTGVLAQAHPDFEVIVVDDASSDATVEIVRRFPRVRVAQNPVNLGPAAARNRGVAESRGDIVVFLDSDSIVDDPTWLARHAAAHAATDAVVIGGGVDGIGRGPVARADRYCHWSTNIPHGAPTVVTAATRHSDRVTHHLVTNNMSVRRATLDLVGPFDERFRTGEDVDFCERALHHGVTLRLEPGIVVKHRDRERLGDFLRCFFAVGQDRIPVRRKTRPPLTWLLPRGLFSSILLAIPIAFGLSLQTMRAWWPHERGVVVSLPLIWLGYAAMAAGIVAFFAGGGRGREVGTTAQASPGGTRPSGADVSAC